MTPTEKQMAEELRPFVVDACADIIRKIVPDHADVDLTDEVDFKNDFPLDSYDRIEILLEIEKRYDINIDLDRGFPATFGELVALAMELRLVNAIT